MAISYVAMCDANFMVGIALVYYAQFYLFMLLSNAQKLPTYIMLNIMSITILQLCHAQFVYDFIILMPTP